MKIEAGTIARTIILVLALVNQILTATGNAIIPIEDETITGVVSAAFTIVAAITAWWKNNSFTKAAIEGDKVKDAVKGGATVEYIDTPKEV